MTSLLWVWRFGIWSDFQVPSFLCEIIGVTSKKYLKTKTKQLE